LQHIIPAEKANQTTLLAKLKSKAASSITNNLSHLICRDLLLFWLISTQVADKSLQFRP